MVVNGLLINHEIVQINWWNIMTCGCVALWLLMSSANLLLIVGLLIVNVDLMMELWIGSRYKSVCLTDTTHVDMCGIRLLIARRFKPQTAAFCRSLLHRPHITHSFITQSMLRYVMPTSQRSMGTRGVTLTAKGHAKVSFPGIQRLRSPMGHLLNMMDRGDKRI